MPNIPQLQFRRYRVALNEPIAHGSFRLVLDAADPADVIPPFQAGQWVYVRLLNEDGTQWAKAAYSIASAPSAGTKSLELAVKTAGDFTQRAERLKEGDVVELQGPWGVFMPDRARTRHVMVAGGIGVTPFLSVLREAAAGSLMGEFVLFYSNRLDSEAAYRHELQSLVAQHGNLSVVSTLTRDESPGWDGERGRIDRAMLERHLKQLGDDEFLLCGPKEFMAGIRAVLLDMGVEPKRIKQELFG